MIFAELYLRTSIYVSIFSSKRLFIYVIVVIIKIEYQGNNKLIYDCIY